MMTIHINLSQVSLAIGAGLLVSCAVTNPPPLPPGNPADPRITGHIRTPPNLLVRDKTTLAIEKELSQTEATAKSSDSVQHDAMEGMQHEGMKMGEHGETKHSGELEDHAGMQHGVGVQAEKKTVADEMKKTADEMKKTSDALKQKSDQINQQNFYYTCVMHPQIKSDKAGKCPICGMQLVRKKAGE